MFIIPKKESGKRLARQRYWFGVIVGFALGLGFSLLYYISGTL